MTKPKPKDFICPDCGSVHEEEYNSALAKWKSMQKSNQEDADYKVMEKRYWKEVDKLSDDTGYFDHEFVLRFFRKELARIKKKLISKLK